MMQWTSICFVIELATITIYQVLFLVCADPMFVWGIAYFCLSIVLSRFPIGLKEC